MHNALQRRRRFGLISQQEWSKSGTWFGQSMATEPTVGLYSTSLPSRLSERKAGSRVERLRRVGKLERVLHQLNPQR